jgi:hypothetical protein
MTAIGTRKLVITIGGEDYTAEVSKAVITSAEGESDFTTFFDAANGGARDYALNFIAQQDAETGSLWDKVWTAAGEDVACMLKPYGNAAASPAQPHFSFTATVTEPDGDFLGTEANKSSTAKATFECSWPLLAKPTKVTA